MSHTNEAVSFTPNSNSQSTFESLGLSTEVVKLLALKGYSHPTPIQVATIPVLLEGRDVIGRAPTGTGKTAAFTLPLLARIDPQSSATQALIVTPTRELALQVTEACKQYSLRGHSLSIASLYGGQSMGEQLRALARGVQVAIGTPGRLCDLVRRKRLDLSQIRYLVLDEADEMLAMGFIDDIEWLLTHTPRERQTALFSATMPKEIEAIADKYLTNGLRIGIAAPQAEERLIQQEAWIVEGVNKLDGLRRFLEIESFDAAIIFVSTKALAIDLHEILTRDGFKVGALHGDMGQDARELTVRALKSGKIDIVIATDVAARGLDVPRITHVFNFDEPRDIESYVHRIGRTGRAGRNGKAIIFISPRAHFLLRRLERRTQQVIKIRQLPSWEEVITIRKTALLTAITEAAKVEEINEMASFIRSVEDKTKLPLETIAASLCYLQQQTRSIVGSPKWRTETRYNDQSRTKSHSDRHPRPERERGENRNIKSESRKFAARKSSSEFPRKQISGERGTAKRSTKNLRDDRPSRGYRTSSSYQGASSHRSGRR